MVLPLPAAPRRATTCPGFDLEVDAAEGGGRTFVAEGDVAELHASTDVPKFPGVGGLLDGGSGIQDLEDPFTGRGGPGEHCYYPADNPDREGKEHEVEDELGEFAGGHGASHDFPGADPEDGDGNDREDEVHQRGIGCLDLGGEDVLICEFNCPLIELAAFEGLTGEGLDDSGPGEVLLEVGAHAAAHVLDVAPDDPEPAGDEGGAGADEGQDAQGYQPELPVGDEEEATDAAEKDEEVDGTDQAEADEPADAFNVGGGAGHEMAGLLGVMVGEAEALEMVVDGASEVVGDLLGDELGDIGLEIGEYAPAYGKGHDATTEEHKEAEGVLFEDLVYGVAEESGDGEG